jgi:hypothetical protein
MKYRFILKKVVPIFCLAFAMGILVFQHMRNERQQDQLVVNETSIVVELFTSQGCSSCPPADALAASIKNTEDIVVLTYHVDYWDRLGWKDTFSSAAHSDYQRRYARKFNVNTYTPEIVINGNREFVGSNKRVLNSHLKSHSPVVKLAPPTVKRSANSIAVNYALEAIAADVQVYAVLVLDQETVTIKRGENSNKKIKYHHVVLERVPLDITNNVGTHIFTIPANVSPNQKFKVVLFSQDEHMNMVGVSAFKSC